VKPRDLAAFEKLNRLVPGCQQIVIGTGQDEFLLGIDPDDLAKVATEEDIIELSRLGVMYNETESYLFMFT